MCSSGHASTKERIYSRLIRCWQKFNGLGIDQPKHFLSEFLEELQTRASDHFVADKITALSCSMDALSFADEEFDVIWSEGAIYNMVLKPECQLGDGF